MKRLASIDIARGLVMVIMALDHTRDLLDSWSITHSPTNLAVTTPLLFFTRWITHFCAPAFVFLAGTSAAIQLTRSTDRSSTRRWLVRRGFILILIEFTIVNFGMSFDLKFRLFMFEVIATIGAGMILLSLLSLLPVRWLTLLTALIFFGHDLLPIPPAMAMPAAKSSQAFEILRTFGWSLGSFNLGPDTLLVVAYPIIPWLGIMLTGFIAGRWFERSAPERRQLFFRTGLIALGLFILLRLINVYGDPEPWSTQKDTVFTLLAFLNVSKYPPSLLFSLLTLSGLFFILAAAERSSAQSPTSQYAPPNPTALQTPTSQHPTADRPTTLTTRILLTYGRVPLFYFIVHFYLIHLLLLLVDFAQGYSFSQLNFGPFQWGRPATGGGLPTWSIYPIWLGIVIIMYPLCRWYGRYKSNHPQKKLLRYF